MSVPDQHIHPVATGAAAQTVAKHQTLQELIFYAGWVRYALGSLMRHTVP